MDNPITQHNNHIGISQPIIMASSNNNGSSSSNNNANIISTQPPQFLKPSIDYILGDDQMVLFVTILKDKVRESPITMATLLACIKSVLESSGIKERLFPNRIRFSSWWWYRFSRISRWIQLFVWSNVFRARHQWNHGWNYVDDRCNGSLSRGRWWRYGWIRIGKGRNSRSTASSASAPSPATAPTTYRYSGVNIGNLSNIKRKRGRDVHEEVDNSYITTCPMKRLAADKHKAPSLSKYVSVCGLESGRVFRKFISFVLHIKKHWSLIIFNIEYIHLVW